MSEEILRPKGKRWFQHRGCRNHSPKIFAAALKHFDVVLIDLPNQPGGNWYKGLALWYLKRHRETEEYWATAHTNLTPGSQDAEFVKQALIKLRKGETPF